MRVWLTVLFVLAAVAQAQAQQTVTQPPPTSPPSTFPQFQTYNTCLMNCDTRAGTCQGTCSVSNSPALTFAAPPSATNPSATRADSSVAVSTLAQCYLGCSTQALVCKHACTPPH